MLSDSLGAGNKKKTNQLTSQHQEETYCLLDFVQKKPFFLAGWLSDKFLELFEPNEKCLRKGFPEELLRLDLECKSWPWFPLPLKSSKTTESSSEPLSTTLFIDLLFLAFKAILAFRAFSENSLVCFSPKVQTGQVGSYLFISSVILSKHSVW